MGTCPGVLVDARQVRESRPSRSVEAARTASAVRGDQDHEDRDHYQRQTYSQPRPPVPLGPSVVPPRLVHLEPPLRASSSSRGCTTGPLLSSPLATICHPGRPDLPRRPAPRRDISLGYPRGARSFRAHTHGLGATARPYSGAAPAWRMPTSSRWRRRSAGSS
jgi:hypothetical protein